MKYWCIIIGVVAIATIEIVAIYHGLNGMLAKLSFSGIGALVGMGIYKIIRKDTT